MTDTTQFPYRNVIEFVNLTRYAEKTNNLVRESSQNESVHYWLHLLNCVRDDFSLLSTSANRSGDKTDV